MMISSGSSISGIADPGVPGCPPGLRPDKRRAERAVCGTADLPTEAALRSRRLNGAVPKGLAGRDEHQSAAGSPGVDSPVQPLLAVIAARAHTGRPACVDRRDGSGRCRPPQSPYRSPPEGFRHAVHRPMSVVPSTFQVIGAPVRRGVHSSTTELWHSSPVQPLLPTGRSTARRAYVDLHLLMAMDLGRSVHDFSGGLKERSRAMPILEFKGLHSPAANINNERRWPVSKQERCHLAEAAR